MLLQTLKIKEIKSNMGQVAGLPRNPRFIKDDKFKKLVKSIQDDPEMLELREIIAYDNNGEYVAICGNMRLMAMRELGIKETPVKILPSETSIDKLKAYTIKDNVGFGEHDWSMLANEWDSTKLEEWGMDLPDFTSGETAEEDDYEIPDEIKTDIVLGDLFEIGEHRLLCGDSTDKEQVAKLMNENKADMVFTDPPFPNNSGIMHEMIVGIEDAFTNARMHCKGIMFWVWDNLQFPPFTEQVTSKHIWYKTNGFQAGHFETIYVYHNDGKRHEQLVYPVENVGGENKREEQGNHPTPKPVKLIAQMINDIKGNVVLDLFLGSGTTMIGSYKIGKICYGMELDPKYCQVIVDRMKKLDSSLIIKRNGELYV